MPMIKIPCLFERDFSDKRKPVLLHTVTPGCEWALTSDGIPTRKRDGTACLVKAGTLFKRYDVKSKKGGTPPAGAIACTPKPDEVTGHWPHWVEVGSEPESRWHMEAWTGLYVEGGSLGTVLEDGTYELCGPKINGNAENLDEHEFFRHGTEVLDIAPRKRSWEELRLILEAARFEGIVFHHKGDGRMCKIRRDDFGFSWPLGKEEKEEKR